MWKHIHAEKGKGGDQDQGFEVVRTGEDCQQILDNREKNPKKIKSRILKELISNKNKRETLDLRDKALLMM